ncbi:AAA family ATPase [Propionivibrio sp.]|uniref:ExeA family protein n=1 Tax=Propionivibrio sp. TaxID=2212460 RepID=UPI0025ED8286|nr:AAA family ATPase [Propionivibrio sp.]MBK7355383.1 AAA family ATPase [Propionivibrio sp.]MBK8399777.1 AAA family ATPase [Propionivibrio sp.]MBK8894651.1 AAA family ATPase [Propionivibrio sp.]MBL0207133.1 AAA family ATPase [Propionivibrio sp.]
MYLKHFGLSELPFGITPDTSFTYSVQYHQEALNTLLMALSEGEGFVKISGEVGTGKTLLCRRLLQTLDDGWVTAYLPNPNLDADTLFLALAEELGIKDAAGLDQYHLVRRINHTLLDHARAKKRVVVCIDEAQAMPVATLEALRLLSNLETEKRKLLQIVLFGQPELDEKLHRPEVRQLLQRIAFHYRLGGLKKNEIGHYIAHRLRVAGYRGDGLFSRAALRALHRASGGTPRLINILAHKSLLSVFGEGRQLAKLRHVRLARKDTEGACRAGWLWG